MTVVPESLRDEVLHIIALGRGRHGWHAIASRLSNKDVPRDPGLYDVLQRLREQGLVDAVDQAEGGASWRLTDRGRGVLAARRTPPTSALFAHQARRVAEWLYGGAPPDADVPGDAVRAAEVEPTPDEQAWLTILLDDARFVLEAGTTDPRASSASASDDATSLSQALGRAHATGDWRTVMDALHLAPGLPRTVAMYFRGRAWHALGFHALACAIYQRTLQLDPHDHRIGTLLLNALADAEDWDRLKTAIEDVRRDPHAPLELALTAEVAAYRAALAERPLATPSRLEDIARKLSELLAEPGSAEILPSIAASGAIAAALCFDRLGVGTKARRFAALATRLMSDTGSPWLVRGLIGHRHGARRAEEHLTVAARLMPGFVWPRVYLAHLAVRDERYAECLRWCEEGLVLAPSDVVRAALQEWRGISRAMVGAARGEARADLQAAIVLDPTQPTYRSNLAAFDGAAESPRYELEVPETLRDQATRAVSFAPLPELAA